MLQDTTRLVLLMAMITQFSIGGNLSNNTNNVQLHIFPKIASVPIVPNWNTAKTKETKPVINNIFTVQLCSDGKTVLLPHSFMPINKKLITCEHAKAYIHLWPSWTQNR